MFNFAHTTLTALEVSALLRDHFDGMNDAVEQRIRELFSAISERNGGDVISSLEDASEYFDEIKSMSFTRTKGRELIGYTLLNDAFISRNMNNTVREVHLQVFTAAINETEEGKFELHYNYQPIDEAFWCFLKDEHRK